MVPLPTPFAPLGETPKERNARREQLLEHSAFFAEAVCAKIGSKTLPSTAVVTPPTVPAEAIAAQLREPLAKLCRADARISDGRCTERWDRGDLTWFPCPTSVCDGVFRLFWQAGGDLAAGDSGKGWQG